MSADPRRLALVLAGALCATAHAGGLDHLDEVDLMQLDGDTRRLQLVVILDDNRVDNRQAMKTLHTKLGRYQRYIASGRALQSAPNANPALRPSVLIVAPAEATTAEMQNLQGIRLAFVRAGADVDVEPFIPGLKRRPVAIDTR